MINLTKKVCYPNGKNGTNLKNCEFKHIHRSLGKSKDENTDCTQISFSSTKMHAIYIVLLSESFYIQYTCVAILLILIL